MQIASFEELLCVKHASAHKCRCKKADLTVLIFETSELASHFNCSLKTRNKGQFSLQSWSFLSRSVFSSIPPSLFGPLRLLRTAYLPLTYILFSSFASLLLALDLLIHTLLWAPLREPIVDVFCVPERPYPVLTTLHRGNSKKKKDSFCFLPGSGNKPHAAGDGITSILHAFSYSNYSGGGGRKLKKENFPCNIELIIRRKVFLQKAKNVV